ncbi:MAG: hypothetical protein ACRDN6_10245, partial [Gaiellaceae bacterium]
MLSTRTIHRLKPLALVVALAAVVAPGARAGHEDRGIHAALDPAYASAPSSRPDDRAVRGVPPAQPAGPDAVDRYLANRRREDARVVPDAVDRYLANHLGQPLRPDDRAGIRGNFQAASAQSAARVPVAARSFHWGDAGIGAASAFAATLLAIGVATLLLRRGRARIASL